ncbi:MAG: OsmC family protein [Candidatus Thorarchaeota archaeon]
MTLEEHRYELKSRWVREKIVSLQAAGKPVLEIATPLDFWPESPSDMYSPEDLFLGSAVSCFGASIHGVANRYHVEFLDFQVKGTGTLMKGEHGWVFEKITLDVEILVESEENISKMEKVAQRAHEYCIVANSMKCPVNLNYRIRINSS